MTTIDSITKQINDDLHEPVKAIPIRGYITQEDSDHTWLRDQGGAWLISKKDIVSKTEWEGVKDPRFSGKPVLVFVCDGADIFELRQFKVTMLSQPVTLKNLAHGTPLRVKGNDILEAAPEDAAAREIGFRPGTGIVAQRAPIGTSAVMIRIGA